MAKKIDTNNKTRDELINMLTELKAKLAQQGFDTAEKKVSDTTQTQKTKKDIARILTRLNN